MCVLYLYIQKYFINVIHVINAHNVINIIYFYAFDTIPTCYKSFISTVIPFALIRGDTYSPLIMYLNGGTSTRLILLTFSSVFHCLLPRKGVTSGW